MGNLILSKVPTNSVNNVVDINWFFDKLKLYWKMYFRNGDTEVDYLHLTLKLIIWVCARVCIYKNLTLTRHLMSSDCVLTH